MPRDRRPNPGRRHLAGQDITPRMQRQYEHVLESLHDYRPQWSEARRKSVAAATARKMTGHAMNPKLSSVSDIVDIQRAGHKRGESLLRDTGVAGWIVSKDSALSQFEIWWQYEAPEDLRELPKAAVRSEWLKGFTSRTWGRNRNSGDDSAAEAERLAEDFHGRAARDVIDVEEEEVYDTHGAVLGYLQELAILTEDGHHTYPIEFPFEPGSENNILVVSDPAGNNIEFVGGDQDIPDWQEIAEATEDDKNLVLIGPVEEINYWADKHHLEGPEEQKDGMTYFHKFGEEGGEMPWLVLDRRNRKMLLVSGSYTIQPEGITN